MSLPYTVDPNNRGEENWQVSTGHYYWVDEPYNCTDRVCPEQPVQVAYRPGAMPRQFGRYFYFLPINIFVTISLSGQGFAGVVIQPPTASARTAASTRGGLATARPVGQYTAA